MNEKTINRVLIGYTISFVILVSTVCFLAHKSATYKAAFDAYVQQDQQVQILQKAQQLISPFQYPAPTAKALNDLGFQVKALQVKADSTNGKNK